MRIISLFFAGIQDASSIYSPSVFVSISMLSSVSTFVIVIVAVFNGLLLIVTYPPIPIGWGWIAHAVYTKKKNDKVIIMLKL